MKDQEDAPPFCFVTSESTQEMMARAKELGAAGFLIKPFTADDIEDTLGGLLS